MYWESQMKNKLRYLKVLSMQIDKETDRTDTKVGDVLTAYLTKEWKDLADKSISQGKNIKVSKESVDSYVKFIDKTMNQYSDNVNEEVADSVEYFYKYFKSRFIKDESLVSKYVEKAEPPAIPPEFWTKADITNMKAIEAQINSSVGGFYGESCQVAVAESIRVNVFEKGLTGDALTEAVMGDVAKALRVAKGKLASDVVPPGFRGTADQYFRGVSNYGETMTRTSSTLSALKDVGVKKFVIRSLKTDRTCLGCLEMDGQQYSVADGLAHQQKMFDAESKDELRAIQPMFHYDAPGTYSNPEKLASAKADAKAEASEGVRVPPFHFRCQCYVDMA